ncbi:hypothetical protein DFS34DRAFT_631148, partial [Phlyctochytrium arcticum]
MHFVFLPYVPLLLAFSFRYLFNCFQLPIASLSKFESNYIIPLLLPFPFISQLLFHRALLKLRHCPSVTDCFFHLFHYYLLAFSFSYLFNCNYNFFND